MKFFATILSAVALFAANVEADQCARFACPRNDAGCKFNRKIKGKWYCVAHKESPECESARDDIKVNALLGTTSDRVDRFDRCWFHGKCDNAACEDEKDEADVEAIVQDNECDRVACPRNDVGCKFNRKIKDKWYCVAHKDAPECAMSRDDILRWAVMGTSQDRVDRFDRCWFNGKCCF